MQLLRFIEKYQKFGCIGMSKLQESNQDKLCMGIGFLLANLQKEIISGNADGADSMFARGANLFDDKLVSLYMPNTNHNLRNISKGNKLYYQTDNEEWAIIAKKHHTYYENLSPYVQALFNRNVGIVLNSDCIIALPDMTKRQYGGTGHSMRIAEAYNKPILNISVENVNAELKMLLKEYI